MMERSQALRTTGYGVTFSNTYLEQGRYAEAMASTGAEPDLVDPSTPPASFSSAPLARIGTTSDEGGCLTMFDADGDGDLDLFVARPSTQRLFRNDGRGAFTDVTRRRTSRGDRRRRLWPPAPPGDVNNDGLPDLFVLRTGRSSLYQNSKGGRFTDVIVPGGRSGLLRELLTPAAVAFADVDHDGDLDIVVAPLLLFRNNGDGTFIEITANAGLKRAGRAIAIVPTDFDNHRDLDLLIVNERRAADAVQEPARRDVQGRGSDVGLSAAFTAGSRVTCTATADVNKDDYPDFFFGLADAPGVLALSDGAGRYNVAPAAASATGAIAAAALRLRQRRARRSDDMGRRRATRRAQPRNAAGRMSRRRP